MWKRLAARSTVSHLIAMKVSIEIRYWRQHSMFLVEGKRMSWAIYVGLDTINASTNMISSTTYVAVLVQDVWVDAALI